MYRYSLLVKDGAHPSGNGYCGWIKEKLGNSVKHVEHVNVNGAWRVVVDVENSIYNTLAAWFHETGTAPYPPGTLLHFNELKVN